VTVTALAAMRQHARTELEPGEDYLAAIRIADPDNGRPLRDPILGPVGMLFSHDQALLEEIATVTMPSTGGILGATATRVLVFGLGSGSARPSCSAPRRAPGSRSTPRPSTPRS
jgi:hypothetical protein